MSPLFVIQTINLINSIEHVKSHVYNSIESYTRQLIEKSLICDLTFFDHAKMVINESTIFHSIDACMNVHLHDQ